MTRSIGSQRLLNKNYCLPFWDILRSTLSLVLFWLVFNPHLVSHLLGPCRRDGISISNLSSSRAHFLLCIPPRKLTWQWKIYHEWRCISSWTWGIFQPVMLVFKGCISDRNTWFKSPPCLWHSSLIRLTLKWLKLLYVVRNFEGEFPANSGWICSLHPNTLTLLMKIHTTPPTSWICTSVNSGLQLTSNSTGSQENRPKDHLPIPATFCWGELFVLGKVIHLPTPKLLPWIQM